MAFLNTLPGPSIPALLPRCSRGAVRWPATASGRLPHIEASIRADVAPFIPQGLPEHVANLLSSTRLSRLSLAASVALLVSNKDLAISRRDLDNHQLEARAKEVTARYMQLKGLWHARGIIEYAEAEVVLLPREPGAPKMTNRVQKWTILMSQNAGLEACIARVTGWDKAWIPERMEALYKQLSGHFHMSVVPTDNIAIVEGILNREQMAALDCVGKHFTVKTELKYIVEPATS